jgi:beta-galactosidase
VRWGSLAVALLVLACGVASAAPSPRERVALDSWRFHLGDAPGVDGTLDYAVRPSFADNEDGKAADARPKQADQAPIQGLLKPWILPTGNALIADPQRRHARPPGQPPGASITFVRADFDDSGWQQVQLPHDWAIAGPFLVDGPYGGMGRLPSWGVGWYRRTLDIPAADRGKRIALEIDGAMSYASVWCNGQLLGGWPYGYSSWQLDLSDCLDYGGRNQLAIRLDNPPDSARWYPGGGLYRQVWLRKTAPAHVAHWGVQITTPQVSAVAAQVQVRLALRNEAATAINLRVDTALFALDDDERPAPEPAARSAPQGVSLLAHGEATLETSLQVTHPHLWGPPPTQQPNRYVAVTTLRDGNRVVDQVQTPFGIRTVRFDPQRGLLVNGEHVPIRGVNQHHDLGALGAAFNTVAAERQLRLLQAMGANAIRMSHNPPAPELLALTDRLGLLVVDEIFDSWQMKKTPLDFHRVFDDWHEPDLRAMLRRDRNHPSVILWSIGNEVGEQYTGEAGAAIARQLRGIVREEDPTRPVTAAMNYAKPDMPLPAELDVIGLNYQGEGIRDTPEFAGTDRIRTPPMYEAFHRAFPDKAILSTETASTLSSRGVYLFPVSNETSAPVRDSRGGDSARRQVSAYELHAVDFGASPDKVFAALDAHRFVAGEFVWTGFDYLGEPTPYYSSRSSYSGIIDLAGFPKDRYWLYQSRWRADLPMAHLLPHWTWPGREGQVTPVHVFTSGDEAELFVNGASQGRKRKQPGEYRLRWDAVRYQPGELRVQAYKDGQPWAGDSAHTAGSAAALYARAERVRLAADGRDLAFIEIEVRDASGQRVPQAATPLRVRVEGPAELLATDNGDPTDMTAFPSASRAAFNGRALAIVRARPGAGGELLVRVEADGLAPAAVSLTLVPGASP